MKKKMSFAQALSEVLIKNNHISVKRAHDIQKAFEESSIAEYEDFLLQEGLVGRDALLTALSHYYAVPAFDVVDHFFDTNLLRKYPKDFLMRNSVIPLEVDENMVNVVAAQPERDGLERSLMGYASYNVNFLAGINQDILDALEQYYDYALTVETQDTDIDQEQADKRQAESLVESLPDMNEEDEGDL